MTDDLSAIIEDAKRPRHNPESCTRVPCGRCKPQDTPNTPAVVLRSVRTTPPPKPQVHGISLPALATRLREVANRLENGGETVWRRFHDWEHAHKIDTEERGGGDGGTGSEANQRDRQEDRRVATYFAEYVNLLSGLVGPVNRIDRLHVLAEVEDRTVHRTRTGELDPMLAAEAAAAGYCASCWRYEQTCNPRERREPEGHYYHRQWCRRCARFHQEHGIVPPVDLLRIWHGLGRRSWTTAEVDAALAKARKKAS